MQNNVLQSDRFIECPCQREGQRSSSLLQVAVAAFKLLLNKFLPENGELSGTNFLSLLTQQLGEATQGELQKGNGSLGARAIKDLVILQAGAVIVNAQEMSSDVGHTGGYEHVQFNCPCRPTVAIGKWMNPGDVQMSQ